MPFTALAALIAATCVVLIRLVTYTEPIRSAAGGATLSRGDGGTAHSPATTETVQELPLTESDGPPPGSLVRKAPPGRKAPARKATR